MPNGQVEPIKSMICSGWEKYFDHVVAGITFYHKFALSNKNCSTVDLAGKT